MDKENWAATKKVSKGACVWIRDECIYSAVLKNGPERWRGE